MHINIATPPPPTPKDVEDAANAAITTLTGGGGGAPPGGDSGGTSFNPNIFRTPAAPSPIPIPYPVAFTRDTANHASDAGSNNSGGGGSSTIVTFGGSFLPSANNFSVRRDDRPGVVRRTESNPLSLAVQAIAIMLVSPTLLGSKGAVAITTYIAVVSHGAGLKTAPEDVAVRKIIQEILHRFANAGRRRHGPDRSHQARAALLTAVNPGILEAARLTRMHGVHSEALARRHLIALLRSKANG